MSDSLDMPPPLPLDGAAPVIRTDFSDGGVWNDIVATIRRPTEENFQAVVVVIENLAYQGLDKDTLVSLVQPDDPRSFLIIVDEDAVSAPEHPVLVVDLKDEPKREFRAVPAAVRSVENNLSLSNMDFFEFANAAARTGVFRGF